MSTQNDWAERFDKQFITQVGANIDAVTPWATLMEIKSFIRNELADARKEVIIKIKNWALRSLTHGNFEDTDILNELLDVLATLREEEEPKKEKHGCCQCYCSMCRDMCFRSKCVVHTKEETK